ncbi:MAG: Gfo/Idh/MocA family oxidoreductase [Planctomycetales bacterium]|nr:Gfo/Idh/MocA family oxidoreductase [Planctomycetales bacterium]
MSHAKSRRHFLKLSAAAAATGMACRRLGAQSANGKLRTAHIGVGGMGGADLSSISSHPSVEVAALCDIDTRNLERAHSAHSGAKTFRDFREMLDQMDDSIDAVIVSTPDHTHAPAAMSALNRGKAVYCQKPLTHEVFEARQLRQVAEAKGLVTQMGIQVHGSYEYRLATALVQSGILGRVSHVYAWSNKNWGYDGGAFSGGVAPPPEVDWNLWIGTAKMRDYQPGVYHPGNWRKIVDFGTGTLGDMGVHIFDTPYRALKLTAPKWAKTTCRPPTGVGHPEKNVVTYEFPGTEHTTDSLIWTWYDGAFAPPTIPNVQLPNGVDMPGQGALFVGERGNMLLPHVAAPLLFPLGEVGHAKLPAVESVNHYHQFVDACLGKTKTDAHFGYAGPLTEALLLGVVANRFPDTQLDWDAAAMRVTNVEDANKLIRRTYREGFEVENLS